MKNGVVQFFGLVLGNVFEYGQLAIHHITPENRFIGLHFCCKRMSIISTNMTQMAPNAAEFGEITQYNAITPFKVTDFATNEKSVCDFLY